ncbi:MAG TPA: Gfo/Idh/MocA family oxidoreductase [Fimbriimonadaceae bacterium]|nr:Gfo/Idh/MocA family oxidoreductase [Fimbriimonadaceae bacterium]
MRLGIIGGGLMGREIASALGRWFALTDVPDASLVAVCDIEPTAREWFRRVPGVRNSTVKAEDLLDDPEVDAVYVAVPHQLHEKIYLQVLQAGKDLLAEKPFGIDLEAALRIQRAAADSGRFVRCSSEFPFFPGAQRAFEYVRDGRLGKLMEVRSGFWHSSDLDPDKPINWKRQAATCGEIGVMGDLGLHVTHLPLRLGLWPERVYAQLQNVVHERPDGRGGRARCDTWDNAILHCDLPGEAIMRLEMKRLAPGETNTWFFEALGTEGGVRFSTKEPKTLWTFERRGEQAWKQVNLGHASVIPAITGNIFEFGFPDAILQMLGAFALERHGSLDGRFGCATVEEAVASHQLFKTALRSHEEKAVKEVRYERANQERRRYERHGDDSA